MRTDLATRFLNRQCCAHSKLLLLWALAASCTTSPVVPGVPRRESRAPDAICFTAGGERVEFATIAANCARAEVVFCGESHGDESTHALELALYEELLARTGGRVVLALEMFDRDSQQALDSYLAGANNEAWFLEHARPWPNYKTDYRPLIELARTRSLPVIASNAPLSVARKIDEGGSAALAALSAEERGYVAREFLPHQSEYWERFARAVRGHLGDAGGNDGDGEEVARARRYSVQSVWDNTMAESCIGALDRFPDHVVLHVNGGFHSEHRDGAVRQLVLRRPATRIVTLAVKSAREPGALSAPEGPALADYVVYVSRRARSASEGSYAVTVTKELRYRIRVPESPRAAEPWPLLVWLADAGVRGTDALDLWRYALGADAAIVVVEPLYPEIEDQLHVAGRWYWPATFFDDIAAIHEGLDAIGGYVASHFPIDRARMVLAGEGCGATVVAAHALFQESEFAARLAFSPREYAKLHEAGLPDPWEVDRDPHAEPRGGVYCAAKDAAWWQAECADYEGVGRHVDVKALRQDGESDSLAIDGVVREALGITAADFAAANLTAANLSDNGSETILLVRRSEGVLTRAWERLTVAALRKNGKRVEVVSLGELAPRLLTGGAEGSLRPRIQLLAWAGECDPRVADSLGLAAAAHIGHAALLEGGQGIPLAPGPFGGTTVVAVPAGVSPSERAIWRRLGEENVLKRRSRFHSLRISFANESPRLGDVLAALVSEHKRNVLIVPAAFCAEPETMRALRAEAEPHLEALEVHWLPGLGGELHRVLAPAQ